MCDCKDKEVNELLEEITQPEGRLLSILEAVQKRHRYLPEDYMRLIAKGLGIPVSRVFSVATFYAAFSLEPKGEHLIAVCHGTACHVKGAGQLTERLEKELGIKEGKTTEDGLFTLESVRCLGCCSLAPVVAVDGLVHGRVKPDKVIDVLARWRGETGDA